ncbi:hypothetical protein [Chryseobacterium sp.]|uniref:hypothetical protein n=1 Tax=Chryseobacterium sp. TaxID=1871047 RepID=UPI0011C90431|nr:hypothetical protein [Chryseobacterium sp.]TXF75926.1 hypothetical protein FUA25_08455 [Chryseobacterium sp.]
MQTVREKQIIDIMKKQKLLDMDIENELFLQSLSEDAKNEIFEMSLIGEVIFDRLSDATKKELQPENNTKTTRNEK